MPQSAVKDREKGGLKWIGTEYRISKIKKHNMQKISQHILQLVLHLPLKLVSSNPSRADHAC